MYELLAVTAMHYNIYIFVLSYNLRKVTYITVSI